MHEHVSLLAQRRDYTSHRGQSLFKCHRMPYIIALIRNWELEISKVELHKQAREIILLIIFSQWPNSESVFIPVQKKIYDSMNVNLF